MWLLRSMNARNASDIAMVAPMPSVRLTTNTNANPISPPIWGINAVSAVHTPSTGLSGTPMTSAATATHMPFNVAIRIDPAKYFASTR